jgi:hypothetical protein
LRRLDPAKTRQTIAHEIGHGVNLEHVDATDQCPLYPPNWTVMVTNYFIQSTTLTCPRLDIPYQYDVSDLPPLTLK